MLTSLLYNRQNKLLALLTICALCLFHWPAYAYETQIDDVFLEFLGSLNLRAEGDRIRKRNRDVEDDSSTVYGVAVVNAKATFEDHKIVLQVRPYMTSRFDPASDHYSNTSVDELYWDGKLTDTISATAGRRQIVSGVALGYNPTDFLSHTKQVTQNNLTDVERRSERKGDNLIGLTKFFSESTLQGYLLFPDSFTNDHLRGFIQYSDRVQSLQTDYSVSGYYDDTMHVGINLASTLSQSITGYAEIALTGDRRRQEANNKWESTGGKLKLTNYDAVLGAQYTHGSGIGLNVEYWRSNTAYSEAEVDDIWTNVAEGRISPNVAKTLLSQNNNLQREKAFARVSDIPIVDDLTGELTGIYGLNDDSFFARWSLTWQATESSTFRLNVSYFSGDKHSEFGMVPYEWQIFSSIKQHF